MHAVRFMVQKPIQDQRTPSALPPGALSLALIVNMSSNASYLREGAGDERGSGSSYGPARRQSMEPEPEPWQSRIEDIQDWRWVLLLQISIMIIPVSLLLNSLWHLFRDD